MMLLSSRNVRRESKLLRLDILARRRLERQGLFPWVPLPASMMFLKESRKDVTCGKSMGSQASPSGRTGSSTPSMRSSSLMTCGSTTSAFFFLSCQRAPTSSQQHKAQNFALEDRLRILRQDIRDHLACMKKLLLNPGAFDHMHASLKKPRLQARRRCSMAIFATFAFEEPWPRLAKASAMALLLGPSPQGPCHLQVA